MNKASYCFLASHMGSCMNESTFKSDIICKKDCFYYNKQEVMLSNETIDHPSYYGGKDDIYEAVKVINAWELNFNLGSVLKYIKRRSNKDIYLENLKKARWYLNYEIELEENRYGKK